MFGEGDLRLVCAGRWLAPVLAHLEAERGSRFAAMLAKLGLSRGMLSAALTQLLEAGWIRRNPGHGHPLRPEYLLTEAGTSIAVACSRLMNARAELGLALDQLSRWTLPLIAELDRAPARFATLRAALAPVTPRALSLTLKQAIAAGLISRVIEDAFPPTASYALTARGDRLAAAIR